MPDGTVCSAQATSPMPPQQQEARRRWRRRAARGGSAARMVRRWRSATAPASRQPGEHEPQEAHQERRDRLDGDLDPEVGRAPHEVEDEQAGPDRRSGWRTVASNGWLRLARMGRSLASASCCASPLGQVADRLRAGLAGRRQAAASAADRAADLARPVARPRASRRRPERDPVAVLDAARVAAGRPADDPGRGRPEQPLAAPAGRLHRRRGRAPRPTRIVRLLPGPPS